MLTLELAGRRITAEQSGLVLRDLAYLDAVRGGLAPGLLVIHCIVSEPTEADAVRYGTQRALIAAVGAGIDDARVLGAEVTVLEAQPA